MVVRLMKTLNKIMDELNGDNQDYQELVKEYIDCLDQDSQSFYSKYADLWEKFLENVGYYLPTEVARLCVKHLPLNPKAANCTILDLACGSGQVATSFSGFGFKGPFDGLDANAEMIKLAEQRNIYRKLTKHYISEENPLPYTDNSYDLIVCLGALIVDHIPHKCLWDVFRVLKPSGIFVFNVGRMQNDDKNSVTRSVNKTMESLCKEKVCVLLEKTTDVLGVNPEKHYVRGTEIHVYQKSPN